MEEPSVLDVLKEKINPKNWFAGEKKPAGPEFQEKEEKPEAPRILEKSAFPWRSLLALGFALIAQRLLEPATRNYKFAIVLYMVALSLILFALLKKEWILLEVKAEQNSVLPMNIKRTPFFVSLPFLLVAFLSMTHNRFTGFNVFLWLITIALAVAAFWLPEHENHFSELAGRVWNYLRKPFISLHLSSWNLLVAAVFLIAAFFHLSQLSSVPLEMTSDHAEKILDINGILHGTYPIFFSANGGREPIQFYFTAALVKWFGGGLDFTTLKLGMAIAFLLGLIYVYKLGEELGNRWTGLLAMLFLGFAAWPNIIARVGLRLILCPVFVAPVMFYLIRGLRQSKRNDFILAGIFLGLGLMGYSAFRIMPFVVAAGILIYILHQKVKDKRTQAIWAFGVIALFAVILAIPLLRYAWEYPTEISLRTVTRMTSAEVPLADNVVKVFFANTWNALVMPFWKDGSTWFLSVTDRPGLDVVTAALYFIGLIIVFIRWLKNRNWQDLFLLVSIPILLLPSILALAFPNENPSPSRTSGVVIPIILVAVIGFQSLFSSLWSKCRRAFGKVMVAALALCLVMISANQNYNIVFNQYSDSYAHATWPSKEIGEVCKDFINSIGTPETCYVSGLGHWVDTRLVAMVAGYPEKDFALWPEDYGNSLAITDAKLFIVKPDQTDALQQLQNMYPHGYSTYHSSTIEGRDFIAFLVPPISGE